MNPILCPSDHELSHFNPGQPQSDQVQHHLQECARCRERLEQSRKDQGSPAIGDGSSEPALPTLPWVPPLPNGSPKAGGKVSATTTPATIGKYRVVSLLAESGQAFVFLALHPTLHKEVVIKWSRWPVGGSEEERMALVREGRLLADFDSPGLARVYDLDFDGDRPFLVMEYIRGRNLKQYADEERPSPRQAAVLLASLARGLETVHARGIIHRDIKPHNIIIDETGRPRWIDFGLAKLRHAWADEISSASVTGTPAYMAPEQARGENGRINSRSDVFALGGVLYFLLTGKPPFSGDTVLEVIQRAARCDWDRDVLRTAGAPRPLGRLCEWTLSANPDDRPASARQVAQCLEAFAARPRRRIQAAVLLLLLMLGLFAWWWQPWASPAAPFGEPSLKVHVYRGEHKLRLQDALPLRSGDGVEVDGQVPRGFEPVLFWFGSEGRLHEMPLKTSASSEFTRFRLPARNLIGPSGTEVLLVCARRSGRVGAEELRRLFGDRPWPLLPAHSLLDLDRREVSMSCPRGPGQPRDQLQSGIVEQAETLQRELIKRCDLFVAVAFPHQQ